ncbi:MAG: helix-turn-helix transcriptional regulator [Clostridia bacterium]|nr:helix-turn-helix transcriptional regulator [Clostridia bacterium]
MKDYKNIFKAQLKEVRKEKGLSQKEVAEKIGVAVSTYANWEQGRTEPGICDIFNLLSCFEIQANDLFYTEF